jgi:AraC-like DNA-binding protein
VAPEWASLIGLKLHSAGTMTYPPGATFGPRRLTDFELVWFISGKCVAYRNGRAVPAPEGTVLLQRPGTVDAYDWAKDTTTLHGFIHFGRHRPGAGWPPVARWPLQRRLAPSSLIPTLFRFILGLHREGLAAAGPVVHPALELLLRAFVSGSDQVPGELSTPLPAVVTTIFNLVRMHLQESPSERFDLAFLARHAHVSPQHLCRVFRRALGRGPMECVRLLRIELAATLLERTQEPVRAVADRTGFASPYHFSRVFREVYGESPRAYRDKFQLGILNGAPRPRRPALFGDTALRWLVSNFGQREPK